MKQNFLESGYTMKVMIPVEVEIREGYEYVDYRKPEENEMYQELDEQWWVHRFFGSRIVNHNVVIVRKIVTPPIEAKIATD